MSLRRAGSLGLVGLVVASLGASAIVLIFEWYRWPSVPDLSCQLGEGDVEIRFASQPREWANLDPDDAARNHYVVNGANESGPVFDPPDGTGSLTYSPITLAADAFPFHFSLRLETISSGAPVYQSALAATCTGVGAPSGAIVDWFPHQPARYYRWAAPPVVACEPFGENVRLRFVAPSVEWEDLPDDATLVRVYSQGGVETSDGPFDLPSGAGAAAFQPPAATADAYPIHHAVRLDTRISDRVAYQSVLIASCAAHGAGASQVVNVPEPARAELALAAIAALLLARSRARFAA